MTIRIVTVTVAPNIAHKWFYADKTRIKVRENGKWQTGIFASDGMLVEDGEVTRCRFKRVASREDEFIAAVKAKCGSSCNYPNCTCRDLPQREARRLSK